jgi:hypothetical protein
MTINLTIPTRWNDLSKRQLRYIARLFLAKLTQNNFRARAFIYLTRIRLVGEINDSTGHYFMFSHHRKRFVIHNQEYLYYLKTVDFLTCDSTLTINRFPSLHILWRRFYGPANSGYNITWLEFINAETAFYAFNRSRRTIYLDQLCAILYRPQKKHYNPRAEDYNGDRRCRFNDFTYQARARWFRFVSPCTKMCIYIFYTGFRNKMVTENPHCFSSSVVSGDPVNPVKDLMATMRLLNLDDITKNTTIQHSLVWEAFAQINDMIMKTKERKKHRGNGRI